MTNIQPLVSIITPSFNKGPFIEETILSVRNQTYKNIEHIIIDAVSTDETLPILKKYGNQITWISEPDKGQSDAINKGWRMAKGEIIAYLNADDTYLPDAVSQAVNYFSEHPDVGMVYGDGITTDEQGNNQFLEHCGEFNLKNLICGTDDILQPSVFLRKEIFETIGDVDVHLQLAMDLDYWIRIGLKYQIGYIRKPFSIAKIYPDAKSSAFMHKYVHEFEYILNKLFSRSDLPPDILALKEEAYNFVYVKGGLDYIHVMMIGEGVPYLWKAFRHNPWLCVRNTGALLLLFTRKKTFGRRSISSAPPGK
jgi:glycosyltransferase involved in cell wall biosynthesis